MKRIVRFPVVVALVVWTCWGGTVGAAEPETPEVQQARELIKDNGRSIVFFALPTYKYIGTGYNDVRHLSDGFELTFTFECSSFWRNNTARVAFYFDQSGQFDYCKVIRSSTHYAPFTEAVGKKEIARLRAFMGDHPAVRDSRKLTKDCEAFNAKELCELFLKLEQARKSVTPASPSESKREPLSAAFVQVAPVPKRPAEFERATEQKRAVVLVHGFRPEYDRFLTARAVVQDWQESDSFMVKLLARDADVYAFAYGQNVPVQQISEAPELATGVARLKGMGYGEIVLVGYSAGGLICRQFVEDHRNSGVTKVVQVCAPNTGVFWAKFDAVACGTQKPFIVSLTAGSCRLCRLTREATIPDAVEFVCVVGDAVLKSDWVVSCRSQWSEDLQQQGVPAVRLKVSHLAAVEKPESISVIARAVREPAPRWDKNRVVVARHDILKD
jgi:hypothetical protein